jgi:hypothetical protein
MTDKTNQEIYMDLCTAARDYSSAMHAISCAFMAESTLIAIKSSQKAVDTIVTAVNKASSVDSWSLLMKNSYPFNSKSE